MKTSLSQRFTALETRQADLERRIAELEKLVGNTCPWTSYLTLNIAPDRCHVCGIFWKDANGYCCNNSGCPRGQVTCNAKGRLIDYDPPTHLRVSAKTPDHLVGTTAGVGDGWGSGGDV